MYRILITDAFVRKGFDVVSVLRHRFADVPLVIGSQGGGWRSRAYSRLLYGNGAVQVRTKDKSAFFADLLRVSEQFKGDRLVFVPVEEPTVAMYLEFCETYGARNFVSILPDKAVFDTMRDKKRLNEFCLANDVPCPGLYDAKNLTALRETDFPVILKPAIGSGSEGIRRLMSPADVTKEVLAAVSEREYLAQQLIPNGHDVKGAFFLYARGEFVGGYTHRRIRTSPPTGGVTVLSQLTDDDALIAAGRALLDRVGWNGLVMLEFLFDPRDGRYKVIEANPRLWGSILLSEFSGVNLLTNYVRLCLGREAERCEVKAGSFIHWLFPVDLLNYAKSGFRLKPFWGLKNCCYINWTFAPWHSAVVYNVCNLFSLKNVKRFLRK